MGIAVALLAVGAWRLADARRVSCAPPTDRLAAVWSGDESNPRRRAVHRAFTGLGRSTAETAWQQVARALDDYAAQWSAMYVQTCEATNVRGEQSGEVLDLRMGCLSEALDGARALTEVLSRADQQTMLTQTVTAAQDLPALGRCADVAALRSAVPLPRDEKTAEAVRGLQRSLRDANVLEEVGNNRAAADAVRALLPRIEATGYKPLVAEALFLRGALQLDISPSAAEIDLEKAFFQAEASRDDVTAAKAVSALVFLTGNSQWAASRQRSLGRHRLRDSRSARRTAAAAFAPGCSTIRAPTAGEAHDFESGRRLLEQAIATQGSASWARTIPTSLERPTRSRG